MQQCDGKCFECIYDDCICDCVDENAIKESRDIDIGIFKSRLGKRKIACTSDYYFAHREERLAYQKARYWRKREELLAYQKARYWQNREKLLAYQNLYNAERRVKS